MHEIPITHLAVMLLPVIMVGVVYSRWVGSSTEVAYAASRMLAQLLLVGYVLAFLFEQESSLWGIGIAVMMIFASSLIALRSVRGDRIPTFRRIALSITLGGGANLLLVIFFVLRSDPWYDPKTWIPISGMIFANGMNAVSLGAERFDREFELAKDYRTARSAAFRAAMIPQINSFMAVGLVSLPGMMTGQILSGVSPLIAVRYQIMVMCMVLGTAGLSLVVYLSLKRASSSG